MALHLGARQLFDLGADAPASVDDSDANPDDKEGFHALAVLTLMGLLGLSLAFGRVLERNHINWMSEAGGALIVGIVVGLVVMLAKNAGLDYNYASLFTFNVDYFFLFLLPPIIFDAGFNLDVKPFFDNVGSITALAFAGTAVSTAVIAVMMWLAGLLRLSFRIPFFHSCLFGAIISATDPVTVLAIFGRMNADANLNALVFGESVLNDAVAIVLYNVILKFGESSSGGNNSTLMDLAGAVWAFVYKFGASLVIGVAFALMSSLLFRSGYCRDDHAPVEAALVIIIAYCSFYLADGFNLSGITSIMFCGIAMAKYCRPNLSEKTREGVGACFRVIAYLAEIFVFIYIGLALFTDERARKIGSSWAFMAAGLLALALSRLANIYPLTALCNVLTPREARRIPREHKHMLWFSGLRGAMAFALATQNASAQSKSGSKVDADSADVILTATFFMVLITVLMNGGAAYYLLKHWKLTSADSTAAGRLDSQEMSHMLNDHQSGTPGALEMNGDNSPQVGCSAFGTGSSRGLIQSIHDYQRHGGLTQQFERLDRAVTDYLVISAEGAAEAAGLPSNGEQQPITRRASRAGAAQAQGTAQADTGSLAEQ